MLERAAAALLLFALSVPLGIAALAVWVMDRQPPLYIAERIGRDGGRFNQVKLRTMIPGGANGPAVTVRGDRRVTRLGAFLRRTKIDELPQLWNVMRGDMGILGPRPEAPANIPLYPPEALELLGLKPGLVSPSSLRFAREEELVEPGNWEESYRRLVVAKAGIDCAFFSNSTWTDHVRFMLRVLRQMLSGWRAE